MDEVILVCYLQVSTESIRLDKPELLEEITRHDSIGAIWLKQESYLLIELAILHRSPKFYDFMVDVIKDTNFFLEVHPNKDGDNLLHLAEKLAPVEKLNEIKNSALAMQLEYQWFKVVLRIQIFF